MYVPVDKDPHFQLERLSTGGNQDAFNCCLFLRKACTFFTIDNVRFW